MKNWASLHTHTDLSLQDSVTSYKEYVDMCAEKGVTAIAFTEHGNIYQWVQKALYCESKGVKYIHGVECYLTEQLEPKVRDNYHTILINPNCGVSWIQDKLGDFQSGDIYRVVHVKRHCARRLVDNDRYAGVLL